MSDESDKRNNVTPLRKGRSRAFKSLDSVLTSVLSGLGLERRLKEHALIDLWPVLAGEPWNRKSRALFIDHEQNLVISVADASTGQELSLLKPQFIKQINAAARSLGISIRGIRLDLKHFHSKPVPDLHLVGSPWKLPEPTEEDLASVELSLEQREEVRNLLDELRHREDEGEASPISAKRVAALFEKELRLREWRRAHGYPICSECGIPANMLHGDERICPVCFYGRGS